MERRKKIIIISAISVSALAAVIAAVLCVVVAVNAARTPTETDAAVSSTAPVTDIPAPETGSLTVFAGEDVLFSTLDPGAQSPVFDAESELTVRCDIPGAAAELLLDRGRDGRDRARRAFV